MTDVKVPIRAASQLTGLSADCIRAWERRYRAIQPNRNRGGRLYSEEEIQRLRLLKRAVDSGHSIGQIAGLSDIELEDLPVARGREDREADPVALEHAHPMLENLVEMVRRYDGVSLDRAFGQLSTLLTPRDFVYQVAMPLMRKAGQDWERRRMDVSQEHLLSSALRNMLGAIIRLNARHHPPANLVFSTPPHELHELGILCAAMLALSGGLGVIFLGANLPAGDLVKVTRKTKARAVVLGMLAPVGKERDKAKFLEEVARGCSPPADILVGGLISPSVSHKLQSLGGAFIADMPQFEDHIRKYGAVY